MALPTHVISYTWANFCSSHFVYFSLIYLATSGRYNVDTKAFGSSLGSKSVGGNSGFSGVGVAVTVGVNGFGVGVKRFGVGVKGLGVGVKGLGVGVKGLGVGVKGFGVGVNGLGVGVKGLGVGVNGLGVGVKGSGVGVNGSGVDVSVAIGVIGVFVGAATVQSLEMLFVSIVTAPVRAIARPIRLAPVLSVLLASARILPTNAVPVPSVAELPTCQNTLHSEAPLIMTTDEALALVSVLPV